MEALFPSLEAAVFEAADSLECIALFAGGDRAKLRVLVCKKDNNYIQDYSRMITNWEYSRTFSKKKFRSGKEYIFR